MGSESYHVVLEELVSLRLELDLRLEIIEVLLGLAESLDFGPELRDWVSRGTNPLQIKRRTEHLCWHCLKNCLKVRISIQYIYS